MPRARHRLGDADRAQLCADVVEQLRRGELCVLPTETVYGIAALPSHREATAKLRALKGVDTNEPFPLHLADARELQALHCVETRQVRRLIDRYWPGPLTLVLATSDGNSTGVRLPAHDFTRAVIAAAGEPLWLTAVHRAGGAPLVDPDAIEQQFGGARPAADPRRPRLPCSAPP
jgi:L-threonylcarbamoyladenylate synthase